MEFSRLRYEMSYGVGQVRTVTSQEADMFDCRTVSHISLISPDQEFFNSSNARAIYFIDNAYFIMLEFSLPLSSLPVPSIILPTITLSLPLCHQINPRLSLDKSFPYDLTPNLTPSLDLFYNA